MLNVFRDNRIDQPAGAATRSKLSRNQARWRNGGMGLLVAGFLGLFPFSSAFGSPTTAISPIATVPAVAAGTIGSATSVLPIPAGLSGRRMHRLSFAQVDALTASGKRGAVINPSANTVTYAGHAVTLVFLADPSSLHLSTPKWQVDGLLNPTITVARGAQVTIDFVNADKGAPSPMMQQMHGFYVTATPPPFAMFPLTEAAPVPGTLLAPLPPQQPFWSPTGMMMRSEPFNAPSGTYYYLCPDMGHAQMGMWGKLVVAP